MNDWVSDYEYIVMASTLQFILLIYKVKHI